MSTGHPDRVRGRANPAAALFPYPWGSPNTVVDFGTFQVMQRKARRAVNPQTGERLDIPAKNVVRFKAGKGLRERVGK